MPLTSARRPRWPGQRRAPRPEVADEGRQHAPGHAAKRAAADVHAHRHAERLALDFLGQVGHRHRRHAAEHEAEQRAQHQQLAVALRERAQQRQQAAAEHGSGHQGLASDAVGQHARDQQRDRERRGGDRQRQAALRRGQGKVARQQRHQRLHAIQQGEGGKAAESHGAVDAFELGAAGCNGGVGHGSS
jgi:hypothetical protein